jgi:signal transduction histidine kinase
MEKSSAPMSNCRLEALLKELRRARGLVNEDKLEILINLLSNAVKFTQPGATGRCLFRLGGGLK